MNESKERIVHDHIDEIWGGLDQLEDLVNIY